MLRLVCILLLYTAILFPQGGKLSFSNDNLNLSINTAYQDTLRLIYYSGEHGLKALQFRLKFIPDDKEKNKIEFKEITKGRGIDLPEWSLQYNIVKNPEKSETTVFVLLWNISTGELPSGNYNDFIRFSYDLKGSSGKKYSIRISDVTGSWYDGTNANISYDTLQIINCTQKMDDIKSNELFQNYPNPFNPSTTISFSLPNEAIVKLKVFNLLGEEVKTVLNEFYESGYHSVAIDFTGFPSGLYFYKLESGEFFAVRKMVLAK